ncbi:uncharacterized protein CC84DRAFT_1213957 [Paraphaeosphaeria sporulosa]|uniref:Uncharacterized protein n=1 Tax=Paraphaeosphaeria sporulosa TaxID=1460663 RepID=A0A177CUV0_9PLEO|nr:uncharacterized protein CC84DRAFT_1213957 [Paraphaeosphaeria sporulosa]OAG10650.1 hypothetical protein CC84DRAFT_1213957 [Paraphaeosphaeria sporulosa]
MSSNRQHSSATPSGTYLPAVEPPSPTADAYWPSADTSSHSADSSPHPAAPIYPYLPPEDSDRTKRALKKNAMRLFARDFGFRPAEVSRWLFPDCKMTYRNDLDQWHAKWEKELFDSAELIRDEQNRPHAFLTAFTDEVFQIIVDPLRTSIKIMELVMIEAWRSMYCEAFVTAAEVMYVTPPPKTGKRGTQPRIKYAAVYDAVREVPETFPDRPQLEHIPAHPLRASAAEMLSFERRKWQDTYGAKEYHRMADGIGVKNTP